MGKLLPSGPIPPPPPKRRKKVNPLKTKSMARKKRLQDKLIDMQSKTKKRPVHPGRNFRGLP